MHGASDMAENSDHSQKVIRHEVIMKRRDVHARRGIVKVCVKAKHGSAKKNGPDMDEQEESQITAR